MSVNRRAIEITLDYVCDPKATYASLAEKHQLSSQRIAQIVADTKKEGRFVNGEDVSAFAYRLHSLHQNPFWVNPWPSDERAETPAQFYYLELRRPAEHTSGKN